MPPVDTVVSLLCPLWFSHRTSLRNILMLVSHFYLGLWSGYFTRDFSIKIMCIWYCKIVYVYVKLALLSYSSWLVYIVSATVSSLRSPLPLLTSTACLLPTSFVLPFSVCYLIHALQKLSSPHIRSIHRQPISANLVSPLATVPGPELYHSVYNQLRYTSESWHCLPNFIIWIGSLITCHDCLRHNGDVSLTVISYLQFTSHILFAYVLTSWHIWKVGSRNNDFLSFLRTI